MRLKEIRGPSKFLRYRLLAFAWTTSDIVVVLTIAMIWTTLHSG